LFFVLNILNTRYREQAQDSEPDEIFRIWIYYCALRYIINVISSECNPLTWPWSVDWIYKKPGCKRANKMPLRIPTIVIVRGVTYANSISTTMDLCQCGCGPDDCGAVPERVRAIHQTLNESLFTKDDSRPGHPEVKEYRLILLPGARGCHLSHGRTPGSGMVFN
jgi:hypothetical protein